MKTQIALAIWLAASGCAWAADEVVSPPTAAATPSGFDGLVGWAGGGTVQQNEPAAPTTQPRVHSQTAEPTKNNQESTAGNDPLPPPPSPLFEQAKQAVAPLSPGEMRQLLGTATEVEQAFSSPQLAVIPKISTLTVDLSPGASLPLVRTAMNYPSSLSFIDSTGAPWKIGAAPLSGNPSLKTVWVPNTALMVVYPIKPFQSGNITVYLEGLSVPIMLTVSSGEPDTPAGTWTVDSRLDLRIPRRGPAALPGAAPEMRIGLHDRTLQAFLDGVPPENARQLKTTGAVPDTTVWQLGDDLYIRSRADIRDEFEQTLSSADGTHLWRLPVTPYVSFSVMGRTAALNVALE